VCGPDTRQSKTMSPTATAVERTRVAIVGPA
jgi:hypothetical protein